MKDSILRNYATHETANARIHELEAKLGLPKSEDLEHIDAAWVRLDVLEQMAATKAETPRQSPQKATSHLSLDDGKPLYGLARAIAANRRKQSR